MFEGQWHYLDDHHTPTDSVVSRLSFMTVLYLLCVLCCLFAMLLHSSFDDMANGKHLILCCYFVLEICMGRTV